MKKQHQNSKQLTGVPDLEAPKRENESIIEGITKKCPHCGESLPEKIAFCLYCMKPLSGDAVQKFASMPQGDGGNRFRKASTKILIVATALLAVVVIVVVTSFITASILSQQGNASHHQSAIATPAMSPNESVEGSAFNSELSSTPQYTQQSAGNTTIPDTAAPSFPVQTDSPVTPTPSPQATASPSANGRGNRPSNPTISLERAIEIAYADIAARGINASFRTDSGMSWERGQWVWELLFSTQGERMPLIEFYINVDDGSIVKFEWDD